MCKNAVTLERPAIGPGLDKLDVEIPRLGAGQTVIIVATMITGVAYCRSLLAANRG
jgi:hypothetical protein